MTLKPLSLLYLGLFMVCNQNAALSLPVDFINRQDTNTIKYSIRVACECEDYQIYVDGKIVEQAGVIESYLESEWNATTIFIHDITTETPKIIAFHGTGGQFSGFANGFIMDMNNGADYTKYQEWKCAEFIPSGVPVNWYMYDYDDSLWEMSKSFGMNYQNNSYQIFETERLGIHLNAEWLWTQDNEKTNVFCRKKDTKVQTLPLQTTMAPAAAAPTTHASVLKTTHHVPVTTHASVLKTTHHVPVTTHASVLKTTHHVPVTTHTSALKTTHHVPVTTHASVLKTTHHVPVTTHASVLKTSHHIPVTTHASVLKTTHHIPVTTHASVLKTTHHVPVTTHASVLKTSHHIPAQTAAPTTHASVLKTSHHVPAQTAAPTTHASVLKTSRHIPVTTHASVLKTTHHVPAQTAAPTTHASVLKTTHHVPAQTAAPTTHASVLKTTHHVPAQTAAPTTHTSALKTTHHVPVTTHASALKTTHHVPAQTAAPTTSTPLLKSEVKNIYNIKIIINNVKVSKNIIDKHMFNIFRYLHSVKSDRNDNDNVDDKLRRELYNIVKQTHTHIQSHYDRVVDYYKKLLRDQDQDGDDDRSDEYGRDEKGENDEKGEKKEIFRKSDSRRKRSSKIIESMMKLNHYIKVIEYKIHFIKGETRYDLLKILYSLKKQYQDDMIQMMKYL